MDFDEAFKNKYDKVIALVLLEIIKFGARKFSIIDEFALASRRITLRYLKRLEQLGYIKLYYDDVEKDYWIIYNTKTPNLTEKYRDLIEEIRAEVRRGVSKGRIHYKLLGYIPLLGYFGFVDENDAIKGLSLVVSFIKDV